ncbi:MAG TPA: CDP-glucose 4,6-dehydratase [Bacteroidales bacterium]|nr:CDP-glucose 4,6-dehydratase [Bacteroidales bacterium]
MTALFGGIYRGRKVLITGHTGFKGSWLSRWLEGMGAEVYGIALEPDTQPNHYDLFPLRARSYILDIREGAKLRQLMQAIAPEVVFHLAAQALVRRSYAQPEETFSSNVMGTLNVLDACRDLPSLKAVVVVTTDKCYDNREWPYAYRENDPLGGKDPYSASKACAEILTASYRHSFMQTAAGGPSSSVLVATARAGNVIGGGDWAEDRIIPDLVRAALAGNPLKVRYPQATRPWQHVLEPLSGYLMLGWRLLEGHAAFAEAWNFGPDPSSNLSVLQLVDTAMGHWSSVKVELPVQREPHEAGLLMLDSTKARNVLGWNNVWDFPQSVAHTIEWYRDFHVAAQVSTDNDLMEYCSKASDLGLSWAKQ